MDMKLLEKVNKYNQYLSFNFFAINGYFALFLLIYLNFFIEHTTGSWILWFCFNAIIISIYIISYMVNCVESIMEFKLSFMFIRSRIYSFVLLFGAILSIVYLIFFISVLFYMFVYMPLRFYCF